MVPVLQARFVVRALAALAAILGDEAKDDPELWEQYVLDDGEVAAIGARFGVAFDTTGLACRDPDIFLFKLRLINQAPYLIHGGYELPLLLDGRKKLARFSDTVPPEQFIGEDRFDRWVTAGALHKEVVDERFDEPIGDHIGYRTVYYTLPGEEWRIPAMKMVDAASGRAGGWNEYFERLEGMLFGYSDEENDWWIKTGVTGGGFDGFPLCCAVDAEGLAWVEAAGFRALPPAKSAAIRIESYDRDDQEAWRSLLATDDGVVAVLLFKVGRRAWMDLVDLREAGPRDLPSEQIPIVNRHLRGLVEILVRRDEDQGVEPSATA